MLKVNIKKKLEKYDLSVEFETDKICFGIIGASGSGKSMTLKCIAGIEKPDEGYIILNDKVLFDSYKNINLKPQDRHIAYLFQNYALFPQMNVWRNIFVSVNKRYLKNEKIKKVDDTIEMMKLSGLEKKYPNEISGGEQQRVALARIIVNEPEFLLLDEAFSSLDVYLKWSLANELKKILKDIDKDAIFVSHDIREVNFLCEMALVLNDGKIVEKGQIREIISNPKSEITKKMVDFSMFTL